MADCRTVKECADFFTSLVKDGKGEAVVLFDTEARKFEYHMARVGRAHYNDEQGSIGYSFVSLHEYNERYEEKKNDETTKA